MQVSLLPLCAISYQLFYYDFLQTEECKGCFLSLFLQSESHIKRCTTKEFYFFLCPPVSQTDYCLSWRTNLLSSPTIPVTQRLWTGVFFTNASQSFIIAELLRTWVIMYTKKQLNKMHLCCNLREGRNFFLFFFSFTLLMEPWKANKWIRGSKPLEEKEWKKKAPVGG